jgi:hypothetical protein
MFCLLLLTIKTFVVQDQLRIHLFERRFDSINRVIRPLQLW